MIDDLPFRPCVGCGYCCRTAPCVTGMLYRGDIGVVLRICPSLRYDDRYRCALAGVLAEALCIGDGCCSPLNSERRERLEKGRPTYVVDAQLRTKPGRSAPESQTRTTGHECPSVLRSLYRRGCNPRPQ